MSTEQKLEQEIEVLDAEARTALDKLADKRTELQQQLAATELAAEHQRGLEEERGLGEERKAREKEEACRQEEAAFYRLLGRPVPAQGERRLSLELENGSRIVTLPGTEKTIRGFSGASLLLVDEAARVANDLYASIRPMLAVSGGCLLAMSSPFETRGWFYDAWSSPESWERYEVPATEVPRISHEFLEEERRTLGEWWFEQEYMCRFLDAETQAFRREDVDKAFEEEVEAWEL